MSERAPRTFSNTQTLIFIVILSVVCAVILSVLASALQKPKEVAKELDRSAQLMIAAKVFDLNGYFTIRDKDGKVIPAKFENGVLVPSDKIVIPTSEQILTIYNKRFLPRLTNDKGEVKTFEEAGIDQTKYLTDFKQSGYGEQPWKLFYEIKPNVEDPAKEKTIGFIIPVNGFGLWDAIYGYIAIETDGNTVIGISWYDQKETPGLGANIAEGPWQSLFPGKHIFQESPDGQTDFKTAPIGITVVKGKVDEVLGNSPKALSAVDGMPGATLTGYGVTDAYRNVLSQYRPFLLKVEQAHHKKEEADGSK